jgi:hypothetical protein
VGDPLRLYRLLLLLLLVVVAVVCSPRSVQTFEKLPDALESFFACPGITLNPKP